MQNVLLSKIQKIEEPGNCFKSLAEGLAMERHNLERAMTNAFSLAETMNKTVLEQPFTIANLVRMADLPGRIIFERLSEIAKYGLLNMTEDGKYKIILEAEDRLAMLKDHSADLNNQIYFNNQMCAILILQTKLRSII